MIPLTRKGKFNSQRFLWVCRTCDIHGAVERGNANKHTSLFLCDIHSSNTQPKKVSWKADLKSPNPSTLELMLLKKVPDSEPKV